MNRFDKNRSNSTGKGSADTAGKPGRIGFDDRGNAVFEWHDSSLNGDDEQAERARIKALNHPGLSIADESPAPEAQVFRNERGLKQGYNPYESGLLPGKTIKKKRDMRQLSKWIEVKKKLVPQPE